MQLLGPSRSYDSALHADVVTAVAEHAFVMVCQLLQEGVLD
jgi:hypothetical protein